MKEPEDRRRGSAVVHLCRDAAECWARGDYHAADRWLDAACALIDQGEEFVDPVDSERTSDA